MATYKLVTDQLLKCLNDAVKKLQCLEGKPNGIATLDSTGNVPANQLANASGGSGSPDSIQTITSGSTATITNGVNIVYVNPASVLSSLSITLPAVPHTSNEIYFYWGGTMTAGTVVTTLSILANSGQVILQAIVPASPQAGDFAVSYKYRTSSTTWYRKL